MRIRNCGGYQANMRMSWTGFLRTSMLWLVSRLVFGRKEDKVIKCTHVNKEYVGQDFLGMYCKDCEHMDETTVTAKTLTCPYLRESKKTKKGKETQGAQATINRHMPT